MSYPLDFFLSQAHVWFTGVGPGAVDLLTVKAQKVIQTADVILHEGKQINHEILTLHKKTAILVDCDEQSPQENANCIIPLAQANKLIARLHTGDPCIFSPALEELQIITEHNIRCQIIPGISAALLGAALAQKSLTPKGTHQAFTMTRVPITKTLPKGQELKEICLTGASTAIYLANKNPDYIVDQCLEAGLSPSAPILVIESTGKGDEALSWLLLQNLPTYLRSRKGHKQILVMFWP